jgi:hypothetical protein
VKIIREAGQRAASITPTIFGTLKQQKSGHRRKFWNPVGLEGKL